jgi:gamma-glutamylcysteine synthetase
MSGKWYNSDFYSIGHYMDYIELTVQNINPIEPAAIEPFQSRFLTVKEIAKLYKGTFSESSIRYLIFHEKENGLIQHIRRIGRKILIDVKGFEEWINKQTAPYKRLRGFPLIRKK